MVEETIGPFLVVGPRAQIDLVRRALDRLDPDVRVDHFVRRPFKVEFGRVGDVPTVGRPAFGFFRGSRRLLQIRHNVRGARNLRPIEVQYTFLHEALGHGGELDGALNKAKRKAILAAMGVPISGADVARAWRRGGLAGGAAVSYWDRPYEAYCDLLVAAVSEVPAIFAPRYTWDMEPARLKEIVMQAASPDPVPEPTATPEPLPDAKVDSCADLRAEVDALRAETAKLRSALTKAKKKGAEIAALG